MACLILATYNFYGFSKPKYLYAVELFAHCDIFVYIGALTRTVVLQCHKMSAINVMQVAGIALACPDDLLLNYDDVLHWRSRFNGYVYTCKQVSHRRCTVHAKFGNVEYALI